MTDLWVEVHGAAGSGKSTLLQVINNALKARSLPEVLRGKRIPLREVRELKELSGFPTVWNVHVLETSERAPHSAQLERLLNAHATKGYAVHSIWSQSRKDRPFTRVVFVQSFSTIEARDAYLKEQATRRGSRIALGRLKAKDEELSE